MHFLFGDLISLIYIYSIKNDLIFFAPIENELNLLFLVAPQ
ncbi:hypothetical protein SAMN04488033_11417 [Salegentibacter agarivorans]|uniref:Uncharacterized protein n=1 Tax=Salegentibacter agarivorans TaxID=345907 RepID=A0A1I2MQY8_9FLAO|nr:hypothetical protein SAMN04488033_11417 [Salegentibacter agarivorans]